MLHSLSQYSSHWFVLNLFQYVTFRAIMAALTAMVLMFLLAPTVIRILTRLKLGQPIRQKEEVRQLADLHHDKQGTPTMGGLLIVASVVFSTLMWARWDNLFVWLIVVCTLLFCFLGFFDDYKKIRKQKSAGITSWQKLFGQIAIAVGVGLVLMWDSSSGRFEYELHVPVFREVTLHLGWLGLIFLCLVMVGSSNAVNLTDGLDGLAIGCTISVAAVYAIFSYVTGHVKAASYLWLPYTPGVQELTIFCAALCGAGLGFLWFNCHPARVFMGDTGSLAIGGSIAVISICIKQELLLVIVGGVFVMEALSVIAQVTSFKLTGKRIFAMSPIHHHFELKGWKETTVVVRFWILSLIFALMGLATLKIR